MKNKIAILVCATLMVSASAFMGYKAYRNLTTPNFLNANIEALTNTEADVKLVDCYNGGSINEDVTSAKKFSICPNGTTDYKVGKCLEKRGSKKTFASVIGKCIEK